MKKTMLLSAALLSASLSVTTVAGEITRSFEIDDSHQTLDANTNGYFEFDPSAFKESNIKQNGINKTYHVGNPAYSNFSPGDATYYINDAKPDHTYKFSYEFFGWPNRATDQKFTIHKLDGTYAEVFADLKRADKAIDQLSLDGEYTGVSHITISNVASNQGTANVDGSGYGTGWVIADNLKITEYAPDDTSGGGNTGGGSSVCTIYDSTIEWDGLVKAANYIESGRATYVDVIGDLNNDGIEDRVVYDSSNGLRFHFMNADLTYEETPSIGVSAYYFVRKAGDFSKDGIPDIFVGTGNSIEMIALNRDGSIKKQTTLRPSVNGGPSLNGMDISFNQNSKLGYDGVAYGDADGDGFTDTYIVTVPGHKDPENYGGALLFQVNEDGVIPSSPNKLKWLKIDKIGGSYSTIDLIDARANGSRPRLLMGDDREFNTRTPRGSNAMRIVELSNNLDSGRTYNSHQHLTFLYDNIPTTERKHYGFGLMGDIGRLGNNKIIIPMHWGGNDAYTGGLVIANSASTNLTIAENVITRGYTPSGMPEFENTALNMRGTNVSVFHNFAGTGKAVVNVGGIKGLYTVTLDEGDL